MGDGAWARGSQCVCLVVALLTCPILHPEHQLIGREPGLLVSSTFSVPKHTGCLLAQ